MLRDIKEIEQKWDELSEEEKRDIFLWKMIWYHHEKHIPGSPAKPIWDLAGVIEKATKSSDALTKSIRTATWVGGIAAVVGVIIAIIKLFM
jgi:hypothetical protein